MVSASISALREAFGTSGCTPTLTAEPQNLENPTAGQARRAMVSLDITIVGAGIGGLASAYLLGRAGHHVTVLESASKLSDVGAGIQITPNMTRLLLRWGLGDTLKTMVVVPQAISLRRYQTGERVGWKQWGETMERDHGAPYYHIHRADLHKVLHELASPYMNFRLSSRVVSIDPDAPSVTLQSGEVRKTDLVLGCDGVNSMVRDVVVGEKDDPHPTGDAAYRSTIPTSEMLKDPELKALVDDAETNVWMGPGRHLVGYCVRGKKEYNLVMIHPSTDRNESLMETNCDKMRADFEGFEPRVQKLLALVPSTLVWTLMDRMKLPTWIHPSNKVCLLGDACHPMLPYRAQGSAMAVEDAAVLGNLFSRLSSRKQIPSLLRTYQTMRYPRATETQVSSRMNQKIFHLEDGPAQQARDDSMRTAMEASLHELQGGGDEDDFKNSSNQWADKARNMALFDYDADLEVDKWWQEQDVDTTRMGKL